MIICKLKELLDAEGTSQKLFADSTGLSPMTVRSYYHNQFSRIDNGTAETMAKSLKLKTMSDLFIFDWEN